jgi:hypothetical protein
MIISYTLERRPVFTGDGAMSFWMTGWTNESLDASLSGWLCVWRDGLIILRPKKEVPWMQLTMAVRLTFFLPNYMFLCLPPVLRLPAQSACISPRLSRAWLSISTAMWTKWLDDRRGTWGISLEGRNHNRLTWIWKGSILEAPLWDHSAVI